jgi:hypothetical protein
MHIRAVVKQGGMLANLNGVLLPRFDYTAARKTEYCVIPAELRESMVYVLYGTVLYPLTTTDENMLDLVNEAGRLIGLNSRLILIAPPNSVGVTPSRESLSYTELTTATLERLLKKAIKQIGAARPAAANRFLRKWVTNAGRSGITARVDGRNEYPADVLSTPAAIADHAIVCDPDRHIEGVNRRKYKIAATVFKDDRRFFRRAIKSHDALSTYTFRRSAQPALRIAAKMGLLKDFYAFKCYEYYREHSGPKTVPLKELPGEGNIQPVLCIAKNLRDLRPTFSSNSDTSYRTEANTYMVGFVLRQWTEKNLKELRALCERFKIGLIEFDYEEARLNRLANKPVRREKVEDTYQALEAFRARGSTEADPSCTTPTAYLMGWQRDGKYHLPFADWCVSDLSKVYPNTVVITTKAQEEKLQKFGLKNLTETLAARLTELAKLREVQYGFAVWQGKMTKHEWSDDIGYVALKLSQGDMEIAKLLFPDKVTPGAAFTEAKLLYNVLTSLTHQPDEVRKLATAATVALATASASTFPQLTIEQTKRKFRYLALLRGAGVVGEITSSLKAELIETIKFLQLHHSKSKLTVKSVPTEAVAIAHKEAA